MLFSTNVRAIALCVTLADRLETIRYQSFHRGYVVTLPDYFINWEGRRVYAHDIVELAQSVLDGECIIMNTEKNARRLAAAMGGSVMDAPNFIGYLRMKLGARAENILNNADR